MLKSISVSPVFPTLTVYPCRQSSKYTIFSRLEATLSARVAKNTVSQGNISQIEFSVFSGFSSILQIIFNSGAKICLFQLIQIAVNRFNIEIAVLLSGNPQWTYGKVLLHIIECILQHAPTGQSSEPDFALQYPEKIVELYIPTIV